MYEPISTQTSCARAWVAACRALLSCKNEAYNVVIDVANPIVYDKKDHEVISLVDGFLRNYENTYPIKTVANTIFPKSLYSKHGSPTFYEEYHNGYDQLKDTKRWGRYFERMTRHKLLDGTTYNPLQELIEKLSSRRDQQKSYKSAYELAVYDPLLDRRMFRGSQCLSFLSFKLHPDDVLMLTAIYRNHAYITRLLGNLIGLGELMGFIANETSLKVGSLTVISTHAEIDPGEWGIKNARELISNAQKIFDQNPEQKEVK
jgi:thymidylate synthase